MLSALMSTLASVFNSSSTLFTMDIWKRVRPQSSPRKLVFVGRCVVAAMCCISILWVPIVESSSSLFVYVQSVSNYLAPPVTCVFLAAIFLPKVNETAVFYSLLVGEALGLLRLVLEIVRNNACDDQSTCTVLDNPFVTMNYLHFALMETLIVWISMLTVTVYEAYIRRHASIDITEGNTSTKVKDETWTPGISHVLQHILQTGGEDKGSVVLSIGVLAVVMSIYTVYG
eukprot:m.37963 g.37963  ORF g.37963 m.37963 type:complete len:229 (+) comp9377_c0_seq2:118-804(+)